MALSKQTAHRKDLKSAYGPMEHRHFATVAAIIRDMPDRPVLYGSKLAVAEHFARELARTNPRFNRSRFLAACDVEA